MDSKTPISNAAWRSFDHTVQSSDVIFDRMRDLETLANELADALRPFANYACDDRERCRCHNCVGKLALAKFDAMREEAK